MFGGLFLLLWTQKIRKMKKIVLLLTLALATNGLMAQTDTLDIISQAACDCVSKKDMSTSSNSLKMSLGLCMMEAVKPYEKYLKREHDLDLSVMGNEEGRRMGQLLGVRMATTCPDFFTKLSESGMLDEKKSSGSNSVIGKVVKIETAPFVIFHVKDENGKVWQLIWLDEFEGSAKYQNSFEKLKGETILFTVRTEQFFDARVNEYIDKQIITSLDQVPPPPPVED